MADSEMDVNSTEVEWKTWRNLPRAESDWKDVFKKRLQCEKYLIEKISKIIRLSFKKECLNNNDMKIFVDYYDENDADTVMHIHNTFATILSTDRYKDLTLKFYSRKVYTFVRQHELKTKWCSLLCKDESTNDIIEGSVLIAQWCNPFDNINKDNIIKQIDDLAALVKEKLKTSNKDPENHDDIIEAIRVVLYDEIGFHGNSQSYYNFNNSFINKVLELRTGIPITLSIVYAAVAERLGLHLDPINFPSHFLLRKPASPDGINSEEIFIDAFHGGTTLTKRNWPSSYAEPSLFPAATKRQIFIRMVANIVRVHKASTNIDSSSLDGLRASLELMLLLNPDDEEYRLMLSRVYLHHGINLDEVVNNLRLLSSSTRGNLQTGLIATLVDHAVQRQTEEEEATTTAKYRTDPQNADVQYRVGMVMRHKMYHYFCVIYGWDHFCNMDENWRNRMGIYNTTGGAEQPFYNVLADDGSSRYASEENLSPLSQEGQPIAHPDIGKYFQEFDGYQYIANELLAEAYPEDGTIPRELLPANSYDLSSEQSSEKLCD